MQTTGRGQGGMAVQDVAHVVETSAMTLLRVINGDTSGRAMKTCAITTRLHPPPSHQDCDHRALSRFAWALERADIDPATTRVEPG